MKEQPSTTRPVRLNANFRQISIERAADSPALIRTGILIPFGHFWWTHGNKMRSANATFDRMRRVNWCPAIIGRSRVHLIILPGTAKRGSHFVGRITTFRNRCSILLHIVMLISLISMVTSEFIAYYVHPSFPLELKVLKFEWNHKAWNCRSKYSANNGFLP